MGMGEVGVPCKALRKMVMMDPVQMTLKQRDMRDRDDCDEEEEDGNCESGRIPLNVESETSDWNGNHKNERNVQIHYQWSEAHLNDDPFRLYYSYYHGIGENERRRERQWVNLIDWRVQLHGDSVDMVVVVLVQCGHPVVNVLCFEYLGMGVVEVLVEEVDVLSGAVNMGFVTHREGQEHLNDWKVDLNSRRVELIDLEFLRSLVFFGEKIYGLDVGNDISFSCFVCKRKVTQND